jgi:hypothetical protein
VRSYTAESERIILFYFYLTKQDMLPHDALMETNENRNKPPMPIGQAGSDRGLHQGIKAFSFQHFVESWQSSFALSAFSEIASLGSCPKCGRGKRGIWSWHMGPGSWQICSRKQITPMFSTGVSSNRQKDVLCYSFS